MSSHHRKSVVVPGAVASFAVAPGPHLGGGSLTTRRMMLEVLVALIPVMVTAVYVFGRAAIIQVGICTLSCLVAEAAFTAMRGRQVALHDGSATITGVILGLSLPGNAPWYVGVIASVVAIGIGKVVFGGLGQNIFNPAMVGRAFVMISFPVALSGAAYQTVGGVETIDAVTRATPLSAHKLTGDATNVWPMFVGTVNGSVGETSVLACLAGGVYLCCRRIASWEIPAGVLLAVGCFAGVADVFGSNPSWTVAHELCSGSLVFGAFFIATDPVTSPLTPLGKFIFGCGVGVLVLLLRSLSGYPEGVMFAVLLMNAVTPLINRWTTPSPLGGTATQ